TRLRYAPNHTARLLQRRKYYAARRFTPQPKNRTSAFLTSSLGFDPIPKAGGHGVIIYRYRSVEFNRGNKSPKLGKAAPAWRELHRDPNCRHHLPRRARAFFGQVSEVYQRLAHSQKRG